jgi:thiol-disulfide isomerase/thioredoxin
MMRSVMIAALAVGLLAGPPARAGAAADDPITGAWKASLTIPSGPVAFGLELKLHGDRVEGAIVNGTERQAFTGGSFDGTTLTLRLDYYDGQLTAKFDAASRTHVTGEYVRQTSKGIGRYPFQADRVSKGPMLILVSGKAPAALDVSGDWVMTVRDTDGKVEEVDEATFAVNGSGRDRGYVTGTVIPVSGDYGLLAGPIALEPAASGGEARPRFTMSRFDGIHVTRLTGELQPDGTLSGEIASGLSYHATWTAVRKDKVAAGEPAPPDAFALTTVKDPNEPFAFALPDVSGKPVSLADERFRGKVVLVDIMGTWCPNCHDETPLLVDLYKKYHADGLEIVMLAYEYTDDAARNARQIEIFRKKYGIEFPILMAGTTAEGEIARTLPQLVGFGAYPTTIFVGRDGRVRKIHAGFSGPATGERFPAVKKEMEDLARELLAEKS